MTDLAHANKDLEDELACTKVETDQQCDDTAKEALKLTYKVFYCYGMVIRQAWDSSTYLTKGQRSRG